MRRASALLDHGRKNEKEVSSRLWEGAGREGVRLILNECLGLRARNSPSRRRDRHTEPKIAGDSGGFAQARSYEKTIGRVKSVRGGKKCCGCSRGAVAVRGYDQAYAHEIYAASATNCRSHHSIGVLVLGHHHASFILVSGVLKGKGRGSAPCPFGAGILGAIVVAPRCVAGPSGRQSTVHSPRAGFAPVTG